MHATMSSRTDRWVDIGDGVVQDRTTGLSWAIGSVADRVTWWDALGYASHCCIGGHRDWRVPSVRELTSACEGEDQAMLSGRYWTSCPCTDHDRHAWIVMGGAGHVDAAHVLSTQMRVVVVRGIAMDSSECSG